MIQLGDVVSGLSNLHNHLNPKKEKRTREKVQEVLADAKHLLS